MPSYQLLWLNGIIPIAMKRLPYDAEWGQVFVWDFDASRIAIGIFDGGDN